MKMDTVNETKSIDRFFDVYNALKRASFRIENAAKKKSRPVVFFGDSITDICKLSQYYPGINAVNRGISGNTTIDLLNRFDLSVKDANPSRIILLIGINDMMNVGRSPEETAENYDRLLFKIRQNCPDVPVVCESVYPGYDAEPNEHNNNRVFPLKDKAEDIVRLNEYIKKLSEKYGCTYADVHSHLKMEDNTMNPAYSYDGCHPNAEGFAVVSKVMRPYVIGAL